MRRSTPCAGRGAQGQGCDAALLTRGELTREGDVVHDGPASIQVLKASRTTPWTCSWQVGCVDRSDYRLRLAGLPGQAAPVEVATKDGGLSRGLAGGGAFQFANGHWLLEHDRAVPFHRGIRDSQWQIDAMTRIMKIPTLQAFTGFCGSLAVAAHDLATGFCTPRQVGRSALSQCRAAARARQCCARRVLPHDVAAAMTLVRIALIEFAWRDESAAAIAHVPRHARALAGIVDRTPAMRPRSTSTATEALWRGCRSGLERMARAVVDARDGLCPANDCPAHKRCRSWASVIHRADHPRVVSTDRDRMVLLVAPFLRGCRTVRVGLLSLHLAMPAIAPEIPVPQYHRLAAEPPRARSG